MTHLLHHEFRPLEENWIKEGVALLAEYIITGYFNRVLMNGFLDPTTSLISEIDVHENQNKDKTKTLAQYGHILQYFFYIYRLCGKEELFNLLFTSDSKNIGIAFVDEVLKKMDQNNEIKTNPVCSSFEKSFIEFQKARFFPKPTPESSYVIPGNFQAQIQEQKVATLAPYSAQVFRFFPQNPTCEQGTTLFDKNICFQIQLKEGHFFDFQ
ncbi:MAG: hypothetical protein HYY61_03880 [Deltaproteobacteria bacterium]|nr:hypothetical protein [Deltaproteobacteria bacterium]